MTLILLSPQTSPPLLIWEPREMGLPDLANKTSGCPVKCGFQVNDKFFIATVINVAFGNSNDGKDLYFKKY